MLLCLNFQIFGSLCKKIDFFGNFENVGVLSSSTGIPTSQITLSKRSDNVTFSLLQRKNFTF